ncbi:hypothetical protein [Tritonibacter mobilis]|uniref:hypothetical protein n=1 Tax=Tritonibacter mobilis TaxID=379347 RepID=UPI0013A56F43|nr:hypothetical protein [Tritonibacter mobilis]
MIQAGMIGPYKDYSISYNNYASLNLIRETMLGLMLGKKHKPKPLIPFEKMFPTISEFMHGGAEADDVIRMKRQVQIAKERSSMSKQVRSIFGSGTSKEAV